MKYLFFDIECACVHKTYAKICAFGYVLCDDKFNILEKEDILINPRGKFELTDRKGDKGIVLPYEYEDFKKYPTFSFVYSRIKALLEDNDSFVMGHAVLNDVNYLQLETRRFGLPPFNFRFADSQLLFMTHINDFSHQFGLEHIASALKVEFTPHRAVDDAYATMRITEALCKEYQSDVFGLMKKLGVTPGRISSNGIKPPFSSGFKRFKNEKNEAKRLRAQKRVEFFGNVTRRRPKSKGTALKGKVITFSRLIEDDTEISIPLVDRIFELGGKYSNRLEKCNIYVRADLDESVRTKTAAELPVKNLTLSEFEEMIK